MPHIFRLGIFGSGALVLALSASAQYPGSYQSDPYYRNDPYSRNDPYYRNHPSYGGAPYRGAGLVDRVLSDLDRSQAYSYSSNHQRKEFDHARRDLLRFRENWSRGRFDRDRLDGAIGNLQRLVNSEWMPPRDREMLSRDLYALRDFRANRGYSGRY